MSPRRLSLRGRLLDGASSRGIFCARGWMFGAAAVAAGVALSPHEAFAAAGSCAPDANATVGAVGPIESCSGDFATGISYPSAVGSGGNFEVDLNAITNAADGGVLVSSGGAVNVTITQITTPGAIINTAGNGISATNFGANIAITTIGGNVSASSIGIYGEQLLPSGSGNVTITVAGNIAGGVGVAGAGAGIVGQVQGDTGNVSITTAANTIVSGNGSTALIDSNVAIYASATDGNGDGVAGSVSITLGNFTAVTLTNAANGAGISADTFGDTGNVNVTLGNGATITLSDGTANDASAIYAVAQDTGNLITGNVAVTLNDSVANHTAITVTGDNNVAIVARNEGNGSVSVSTGANNKISVSGDTSSGIFATTDVGGNVTGTGNVIVTTGAGSDITISAGDGSGGSYPFSAGIFARSNGGDVGVTTGGNITVSGFDGNKSTWGIYATTTGAGNVAVTANRGVVSQWGDAVFASAGNGTVAVNTGNYAVSGAGSGNADGIEALSGGGNITVAASSTIIDAIAVGATNTGAGIRATSSSGNISIAITGGGSIGNIAGTSLDFGVLASSSLGSVTISNSSQIGFDGGAGNGVDVSGITAFDAGAGISITNSGAIHVDNDGTNSGNNAGIFAYNSGGGPVSVVNTGLIDPPAFGIYAFSAGNVSVANSGNIAAALAGINATGNGSVAVTNNGATVQAGTNGIVASSNTAGAVSVLSNLTATLAGNITSFNNPNVIVTAGNYGILAQSDGGDVLVSGTGRDLLGTGLTGDDGLSGNVSLTVGAGNASSAGILAVSTGGSATVRLAATNAGNATMLATTRGTVSVSSANLATGINVQTLGGNATVVLLDNSSAGSSITVSSASSGAQNTGIYAVASPVGNATTSGDVVVSTGNFNNVIVSGDNSVGLLAQSSFGNVTVTTGATSQITVTPNASGANDAGYDRSYGIRAGTTGAGGGNVTVTNNSVIAVSNNASSATNGIFAFNNGSGAVIVGNTASITSNGGSGIRVVGYTGTVVVGNSATVKGLGTSSATAAVSVASFIGNGTTGNITISNNGSGVISSIAGNASDFAISATAGSTGIVTINNAGRITGAMDLSGAGASYFTNSSALSWHTSGNTTFTSGSDTVTNTSTGRIATSGATTFNFLGNAGIVDSLTNSGTLIVGETSGASTLTITKTSGNLTIANSGTIWLGSLNSGLNTDGQTNDRILAQGANIAFVSSGNSRLRADAFLGDGANAQRAVSAGGTGCSVSALFADCMTIGASSGNGTRVSIVDTNAVGTGTLNLDGTVIVDAISGAAGDFYLSTLDSNVVATDKGPSIIKGFVQYLLAFDATNVDWDLVGLPTAETFELSKITAGAQSLWHESADSWSERTTLLRHDYARDSMTKGFAAWGKVFYGEIDRTSDNSLDAVGTTYTYDTSYGQSYGGLQFGADYTVRRNAGAAWVFGGLLGYTKSRVDFDATSDNVDYSGFNVGAYASYLNGPVFADLLVKDDFAKVKFNLASYSGLEDVQANSLGAEFTIGARFGRRLNIEPLATLAYLSSSLGNLDTPGMNFEWQNGTSFRGELALRLSKDIVREKATLQPFILGGVGEEFNGSYNLMLTSGSSNLLLTDEPLKTFAVGSVGFNFLGGSGWTGYVRGDGMFGNGYHSTTFRVGMRIQ